MDRSTLRAAAALVVLLGASTALGARPEPVRGLKFQASLVTAVEACSAPNDSVTAPPFVGAACHPAAPIDSICQYDPASEIANGSFDAKVVRRGARQDIKLHALIRGLNPGCEGLQLCIRLTNVRITTPDCTSADPDGCTIPDIASFAPGLSACCLVGEGQCRIDSSVDEASLANFVDGGNLTIAFGGAALYRINGASIPTGPSFVTGLLAP